MKCPLFSDKKLEIYNDIVVIKDYHAPRFHKTLPISNIKSVNIETLTFRTGKYKLWGAQGFGVWLPFHWRRDSKKRALVIRQKSGLFRKIVVTLDAEDPFRAYQILGTRT